MHAKSGLRVVLEWKIYRPDSVIAAVILLSPDAILKRTPFSIYRMVQRGLTGRIPVSTKLYVPIRNRVRIPHNAACHARYNLFHCRIMVSDDDLE